jgi:putative flippase GtrA
MNKLKTLYQAYLPLLHQLCRFGVVGLTAAALHFSVVVALVQTLGFEPLVANIFAFIVSFQMSYWGHRCITFSGTAALHREAYPKLVLVQILNFCANESLFYLFLRLHMPYPVALLIVLAILPIFTFICSKWWIFK